MAEYSDREHFIPLRKYELVDLLCSESAHLPGDRLSLPQQVELRLFCDRLGDIFHAAFYSLLEKLIRLYSPFDPDSDAVKLKATEDAALEDHLSGFFHSFDLLLKRANYSKMTVDELERASETVSKWGINLDVDLTVFSHLALYCRGDVLGTRVLRRARNWWRPENVEIPVYQRVVIAFQQTEHKRLGKDPDTRSVFLKLFKDIPKMDLEMLLPGGKLKMPAVERGKIGASLMSSIAFVAYKIAREIKNIAFSNPLTYYGPLALLASYGYRQYAGYQNTKRTYSERLAQSLYYQNLDNNAGVFFRVLIEAMEQEFREAILGYCILWRNAAKGGMTLEALDDAVEGFLEAAAGIKVDFEIRDAMDKLERLKIVESSAGVYRALPLAKAFAILKDLRPENVVDLIRRETANPC